MGDLELLADLLKNINSTVFNACVVANKSNAKDECIKCIKIMNGLLAGNTQDKDRLMAISSYLMSLYGRITENKIGIQERFLWLCSKRNGVLYYPVVEFNCRYDSVSAWEGLKLSTYDDSRLVQLEIPPEYNFQQIQITNWDMDGTCQLYQDLLNDCSYVSSVLSIAENTMATQKLNGCVYPREASSLYHVRLFFNGCERIVVVDNLLPFPEQHPSSNRNNRQLIISSIETKDLYWPALVEKAYIQLLLNHGYHDFQGSNMATDTFMLIGWIPEVVRIHLDNLDEMLVNYFQRGEVLIGLGTGVLTDKVCKELKLVSNHDYAVTSIAKEDGNCLQLKNSWLNQRSLSITGLSNFKYLYLNWNPKTLFGFKSTITFKYQNRAAFGDTQQFLIHNKSHQKQELWILLERHLSDSPEDDDAVDIWININIYDVRTKLLNRAEHLNITRNKEMNNRLFLLKFILEPSKEYMVVPECSTSTLFSLHAYNNIGPEFSFEKAAYEKPFTKEITGNWDTTNLGSPYNKSSYIKNPQYVIPVTERTDVDIALFANDPCIHVNFHIFYCGEEEITSGTREFDPKSLLSHESYEQNTVVQNFKDLEVGNYRIVVSNIENVIGKYKLVLNSTKELKIAKIPTSLGLFLRQCTFDWNNNNSHKLLIRTTDYNNNIRLHLHNYLDTPITELLQYRPFMRASLFNRFTSQSVFINETWCNNLYGLFYDWTIELPGEFILLVELQHTSEFHCSVSLGNNKDISLVDME